MITTVLETLKHSSTMELSAVALGLVYVLLSTRQNPWCWPLGIGSVLLWMIVVFQGQLYMDALLQFVYLLLGFYGWHYWLAQKDCKSPKISRLSKDQGLRLLVVAVLLFLVLGSINRYLLQASYPWFDTLTTVISLIAQWLLARKVLETWILWIIANIGYVVLYFLKDWMFFSLLMIVYALVALEGYRRWRKSLGELNFK